MASALSQWRGDRWEAVVAGCAEWEAMPVEARVSYKSCKVYIQKNARCAVTGQLLFLKTDGVRGATVCKGGVHAGAAQILSAACASLPPAAPQKQAPAAMQPPLAVMQGVPSRESGF
jgi:hypothetical protein